MTVDLAYLVAGVGLFLGVAASRALRGRAFSTPIVVLLIGVAVGLFVDEGGPVSPTLYPTIAEHVTEATVIVALMGIGLAIDRPPSWREWTSTRRLLLVAMPLTIAAVAVLAWGVMGIAPAAALLIAAALAPTDPVLASEVQVTGPIVADDENSDVEEELEARRDGVQFALTSEAGLNDGLAFPFVYAAIFVASLGAVGNWGLSWLGWDLVGKVAIGAVLGWATGKLLATLAFRASRESLRFAEGGQPLVALAATFAVYGLAEVAGGYGFIAVFVAAVSIRSVERFHGFHAHAHGFIEQLEHILTFGVLLLLGIALSSGLLAALTWQGALVGVLLILLIRPAVTWVSLMKADDLGPRERRITAFFGVRGIGSLYYVSYAVNQTSLPDAAVVWSTVAFTVVLSVLVHGVTASPAMAWLARHRDRAGQVRV